MSDLRRYTVAEQIDVMRACANGLTVQFRRVGGMISGPGPWHNLNHEHFNWMDYEYRVPPEKDC